MAALAPDVDVTTVPVVPDPVARPGGPGRAVQVIGHLAAREFRIRYESAFFGWMWALAPAVLRFTVLGLVFSAVLPGRGPDYLAELAVGVLGWQWFSAGLEHVTGSPVDRGDLLAQPALPRTTVPVVSLLTDGFDYLAGLPVLLVIVFLDTGRLPMSALLLPVLLLLQGCLTLGLGMAAAAVNVRWRDTRMAVAVVLSVGIYVTPVFFTPSSLPASLQPVVALNPLGALLEAQRDVLVRGELPGLGASAVLTVLSLAVLAAGWWTYRRRSATFLDYV